MWEEENGLKFFMSRDLDINLIFMAKKELNTNSVQDRKNCVVCVLDCSLRFILLTGNYETMCLISFNGITIKKFNRQCK